MSDGLPQPSCLSGFEHINRYWDKRHKTWVAKILPGEFFVTGDKKEAVATTLGSCVSACIRDKELGIGGMNHFMLPQIMGNTRISKLLKSSNRYGSFAMESLINEILKQGGSRANLEIKLTGGGRIMNNVSDIGELNIAFALEYLATEQLKLIAQDVGGDFPRKVIYYPSSGRLRVKKLRTLHNNTVIEREKSYRSALAEQSDSGTVELF